MKQPIISKFKGAKAGMLVLISISLLLSACQMDEPQDMAVSESLKTRAKPAKIFVVQSSHSKAARRLPGIVLAADKAPISFRVTGQMDQLLVQPGDKVKQGQLLAVLDDQVYQHTLSQAEANHDLAKVQHEQIKQLYSQDYASKAELDKVKAQLKATRAAQEIAQNNLAHTKLYAPMDGVVDHLNMEAHQLVSPQVPVMQLRTEDFDVQVDIPETMMAQSTYLQNTNNLCVDIYLVKQADKRYRACYKERLTSADPMSRTYSMVFGFVNQNAVDLLPGMGVEVDMAFDSREESTVSIVVPVEAVFEQQEQTYVWLVNESMQAKQIAVEVGAITDKGIQVTQGLAGGNRIIAAGVDYIRPDMLISAWQKERGL